MRPYEHRFPWNLDWNLLRTFMVIVEQRGITKSAAYLGLTQPTLSSALKRLEETVEQKLIERSAAHFKVTAAGEMLYKECSSIFGAVSQIPGLLTGAIDVVGGHVSLALTSHVVSHQLDELLRQFADAHSAVTFSLAVVESETVVERIRANRATLGLCLLREPHADLRCEILYRQAFGLYCGPNHRLFGRKEIELEELKGETSVAFQTEVESGPLYQVRDLRERLALDPMVRAVSANLPELRRMVVIGVGIGALPVHIARRDVDAGLLWQLPPFDGLPMADMYLVSNPMRSLSPGEARLLDAVYGFAAETRLDERTYL